jgi:hypothetical protein
MLSLLKRKEQFQESLHHFPLNALRHRPDRPHRRSGVQTWEPWVVVGTPCQGIWLNTVRTSPRGAACGS